MHSCSKVSESITQQTKSNESILNVLFMLELGYNSKNSYHGVNRCLLIVIYLCYETYNIVWFSPSRSASECAFDTHIIGGEIIDAVEICIQSSAQAACFKAFHQIVEYI